MKGIEITAINILDKEIKIKGVWDELEPKKRILETTSNKIFEINSSCRVNYHTTGKV